VNSTPVPVIKQGAHKSQNGFVRGRQLLQNVLGLDTFASMFGVLAEAANKVTINAGLLRIAVLVFFDFAAAFPSVAHQWVFIVLEAAGAPQ
jgi:hypothetical protein